jgi:hypothetical protein
MPTRRRSFDTYRTAALYAIAQEGRYPQAGNSRNEGRYTLVELNEPHTVHLVQSGRDEVVNAGTHLLIEFSDGWIVSHGPDGSDSVDLHSSFSRVALKAAQRNGRIPVTRTSNNGTPKRRTVDAA